jgi:hypothetical protein
MDPGLEAKTWFFEEQGGALFTTPPLPEKQTKGGVGVIGNTALDHSLHTPETHSHYPLALSHANRDAVR